MSGTFANGALLIYRAGNWFHRRHMERIGLAFTFLNRIIYAAVIPSSASIGKDCVLGYAGLGIVIHHSAIIGDRVHICQNVTIGRHPNRPGVPRIEDDVYIGPGAVLSGEIVIGQGSTIGANAVVLEDVPRGKVAAGVPARVIS